MAIRAGCRLTASLWVFAMMVAIQIASTSGQARLAANPCLNRLQSQTSSAPPEPRRSNGL